MAGRLWIPPCSQFRQGGVLRVVHVLQEMATAAGSAVVLDTGDMAAAPGESGAVEFEAALSVLRESGLQVAAVGERDLRMGLERWKEVKNRRGEGVAFLCANLRDERGLEVVPSVAHFAVGRRKVLVTAVLSPSFEKELREAGVPVRILPPLESVREALRNAGRADYVAVLSHAPAAESRALAEALPEADLVVTAHAGTLPSLEPEKAEGRLLVAPGSGWQFVSGCLLRDAGEGKRLEFLDHVCRAVNATLPPSQAAQVVLEMADLRARDPGFLGAVLRAEAERAPEGAPRFAGPGACVSCHPAAHAKWKESDPHARSAEGVRRQGFGHAWHCLPCHTTGPGRPGGHLAPEDPQEAVACEACHGPAGAHVAEDGRSPLADPRASCAACHVPEMSPGFRFEEAWPRIVHGR